MPIVRKCAYLRLTLTLISVLRSARSSMDPLRGLLTLQWWIAEALLLKRTAD